jgi:hypothetical protein
MSNRKSDLSREELIQRATNLKDYQACSMDEARMLVKGLLGLVESAPASSDIFKLTLIEYNDRKYMKIIPSKRLFNSTMIHEVVTRGDFFAVDMESKQFTVLGGDLAPRS